MARKSTVYGSFVSPRPQVRFALFYTNGTKYITSNSVKTPVSRRMGRSSTITYQNGKDGRFRPCSHTQEHYLAKPLGILPPYLYARYNDTPVDSSTVAKAYIYDAAADTHARRYSNFTSAVANVSLSVNSINWNSLSSTALQTMLPSFHSKNSLVNFLLELKDFKSVVKYMSNKVEGKVSLLLRASRIAASKQQKPFAVLSRLYLSYSFGWKPLFNDVVSFIEEISGFKAKYDELMKRAGSPQQSYWGTTVSGTAFSENTYYTNGVGDGPEGGWTGPFHGKCRVRVVQEASPGIRYSATVRYRYAMPSELQSVMGKIKSFLDLLGVARNPAILWNAIPFSFIIDWIVNVNQYLERLRVDNVDFKTEILDFCHSARVERNVRFDVAGEGYQVGIGYYPLAFTTTDFCKKIVYERKLGIPNYLEAIQTSGLNTREFSLAAALAGARPVRRLRQDR